ncbi:FAD-binding monooxygenase [Heterostelium album PN500]|uniref:FAD-binding monooxygenase n=1 Tax=Heterostelium pallidum (strain ATCC 26659 / Pp 5 / PN500) TaxID=670386 RepID=D3AYZ7_HETP5|nr:FAD-binding monooxygenase [Heterostelium album PN500]EFA85687.1 FAD-binding monooxygenase [Heterostelium album PN500]|eukprot:XP_020437794.1 FAD-binding monooxygenase [Heterostelium album PN500]
MEPNYVVETEGDEEILYHYDVVIVGYGPNGATLANILGKAGIKTLVIESNHEPYSIPRAAHMDDEALRILQYIGLDQDIIKQSYELPVKFNRRYDDGTILIIEPMKTQLGHPRSIFWHQPTFETILRKGVGRFDCVDVWLAHKVMRNYYINDSDDTVYLDVLNMKTGEEKTIWSRFLIGADGASSPTRKSMGSNFSGTSGDDKWLAIDLILNQDHPKLPHFFQFMCKPERPAVGFPKPDNHFRYEFLLSGDEEDYITETKHVDELLVNHGADPNRLTIIRNSVFTFHTRIADRWYDNRAMMLVGDACHSLPPFLGLGISSGLRDSLNLAWKLKLILLLNEKNNISDEHTKKILNTYMQERRPDLELIAQNTTGAGGVIMSRSKIFSRVRDMLLILLVSIPAVVRFIKADGMKPRARADSFLIDLQCRPSFIMSFVPQFLRPLSVNRKERVGLPLIQPEIRMNQKTLLLDDAIGYRFSLLLFNFSLSSQQDIEALAKLQLNSEYCKLLNAKAFQILRVNETIDFEAVTETHNSSGIFKSNETYSDMERPPPQLFGDLFSLMFNCFWFILILNIFSIGSQYFEITPKQSIVASILVVINAAIILTLHIVTIVNIITLPNSFRKSYNCHSKWCASLAGKQDRDEWGPRVGLYFCFVCFVCSLVCLILAIVRVGMCIKYMNRIQKESSVPLKPILPKKSKQVEPTLTNLQINDHEAQIIIFKIFNNIQFK